MEYPQYNPQSDHLPLSDEELSTLDDMLTRLPSDGAMNIEALDGYLAGLLLSPRALADQPGADWLPLAWGGDGDDGVQPFVSGKQKKRVMMLVLRHLQSIAWQWSHKPALWEPIFSVAETEEGEELTDAGDWALGFMSAVDLAPEAWRSLLEQQAELLKPITTLADENAETDDEARDQLSRAVPDAVLALYAHQQAQQQQERPPAG